MLHVPLFSIVQSIKYNYINKFLENYFCGQVTRTITRIICRRPHLVGKLLGFKILKSRGRKGKLRQKKADRRNRKKLGDMKNPHLFGGAFSWPITRIAATSNRKSLATVIATQKITATLKTPLNCDFTAISAGKACDLKIVIGNR